MDVGLFWLIPLLPLLSFLLIVCFTLSRPRLSGYLTIAAIGGTFILSWLALITVLQAKASSAEGAGLVSTISWLNVVSVHADIGILLDPLTAVMLIIVTTISLLVQVYSQGYMAEDPGYSRYFAFMSLFTMSMLGLVLANNFLQLYIFWELVGLCSYLLIGFWYRRPEAAAAAKKAFITTRLGDLGFLVGILLLYTRTGTFDFAGVEKDVAAGSLVGVDLTIAMVLVFAGAVGKSAQFPLHVWLPDAMEGPTPVSALIHAATMVAAGVYLVARAFPLFSAAPESLTVVAYIGGFTALFAATMGLVMRDIKRVLAYSTISQLGYMMLGLGVGSQAAGIFHLFNHAFFKAMLFLAAGCVIHAANEQDMFKLGGFGSSMKVTAAAFLIGGLSLAGFPLFSGFWSKDEVLTAVFYAEEVPGHYVLFAMGLGTAFLTAFYIFRAFFLTFTGSYRGPASHGETHFHLPGAVMNVPLLVLMVPAVLSGFLGSPLLGNWFGAFLTGEAHSEADLMLMAVSSVVAILGIGLAWALYVARIWSVETITNAVRPAYKLLYNKYYMDDIYGALVERGVLGLSSLFARFDRSGIDGVVNGVARGTAALGRALSRTETGIVPNYGLALFSGVIVIGGLLLLARGIPIG